MKRITHNFGPYLSELEPMTSEDVARLTMPQRERRVELLCQESNLLLDKAIEVFVEQDDKHLAGVVGLFSGGNDSTVLCRLMRDRITHLGHANTTIGVEQTRQFVRDVSASWGVPLMEFEPPREADRYRALVLDQGFPGPGHHFKMYQRLKERALRKMRGELVTSRKERVIFLAGRRRDESSRRAQVPEMEREGSMVWASPMVSWTKLDLNTYRLMVDVPVNQVSELLHMSGECLCGSFAHRGELDEVGMWFPDVVDEIRELEQMIADRSDIPDKRKRWGWGAGSSEKASQKVGALCTSCDARWQQTQLEYEQEGQE